MSYDNSWSDEGGTQRPNSDHDAGRILIDPDLLPIDVREDEVVEPNWFLRPEDFEDPDWLHPLDRLTR